MSFFRSSHCLCEGRSSVELSSRRTISSSAISLITRSIGMGLSPSLSRMNLGTFVNTAVGNSHTTPISPHTSTRLTGSSTQYPYQSLSPPFAPSEGYFSCQNQKFQNFTPRAFKCSMMPWSVGIQAMLIFWNRMPFLYTMMMKDRLSSYGLKLMMRRISS